MAKDPAFLFYSQDWIVGCQTLSMAERGQYITLLAMMHQQGPMDEETIRLLVGSVSVRLMSKFYQNDDGNYYQERLEKEVNARKKFVETRRENGAKGGRPKDSEPKRRIKPLGKPKPNLMEDVNEIENVIDNKDKEVQEEKGHQVMQHPYIEKIKREFPVLLKMKQPLTEKEAERLEQELGDEAVFEKLEAMANKANILKNYISTNLTIRSWVKYSKNHGKSITANTEQKFGRISARELEEYDRRPKLIIPD
jgi:uncharacterized protein YdaU (DUF1376 family)